MWPVHTWLPDAHVEAPTGGSIVLAAIALKLGAYGFLRFSLPIAPDASHELSTLVIALSLIAVVYIGFVALVQADMKKLVAYSSIAHMGFVTLGFFMFSAMGIEGAAIATNIGRGTGVCMQLWILFKGGQHIKASVSQIKLHWKIMVEILHTSLGGIGQAFIGMSSWIFLMRILADISSEAVAGATIAMRIMMFTMMPAWGLSNAVATLVGQNLGAQQAERAESSVWKIGMYNMVYMLGISFLFFFYHDALLGIFTDEKNVIAIGGQWLRMLSYCYFVYGWWMVSTQAFNGAGDTMTPTRINLVFFWVIQIPLAYTLAIVLDWQHSGVFWAIFITETSVGLFTLWLFTKGKWKTFQL